MTRRPSLCRLTFLVAVLLAASPAASASSAWLGNEICEVLVTLVPEVQQFDPGAARRRFIAAIQMKFREDPAKLRQVQAAIDRETMATCRKERESLMKIMQTLSLSEAFEQPLF